MANPAQVNIGWKLDHGEPVLLVYNLGDPVPHAELVEGPTRFCPGCRREYAAPVIRYPSDPLLFFAVLGLRHLAISRG